MLHEQTIAISPEFNQFTLSDTGLPPESISAKPAGHMAMPAPGGALFFTNTDLAELSVRVEVWSAAPPGTKATWDREVNLTATFSTRRPTLASVTPSPRDRRIELPHAGTYVLEARRNESLARDSDFEIDYILQNWLLRLWPEPRRT
ncbi:hypothetical protein ACPZ19_21755 [Amycolatopsis lurida]